MPLKHATFKPEKIENTQRKLLLMCQWTAPST